MDALYMAFHMCHRKHPDYYVYDILSDLLCNGRSSRLVQSLVINRPVFSSIDAYISGSLDEGLLQITGKPSEGVSLEEAEKAIWEELEKLKEIPVRHEELEKVKNRYESEQIFSNLNYLNVATNLAYFELTGEAEDINREVEKYRSVTQKRLSGFPDRHSFPKIVMFYIIELFNEFITLSYAAVAGTPHCHRTDRGDYSRTGRYADDRPSQCHGTGGCQFCQQHV